MTFAEMPPADAPADAQTDVPAAHDARAARPSVRLTYSRTSVVCVLIAIALMLTGAVLLTVTDLGILAWTLTLVGLAVELFAISRPRVERA